MFEITHPINLSKIKHRHVSPYLFRKYGVSVYNTFLIGIGKEI